MEFPLHPYTILMVVGGSRAYGTHDSQSDVDIRGCAIAPMRYYTGIRHEFGQADNPFDMTVFLNLSPQEEAQAQVLSVHTATKKDTARAVEKLQVFTATLPDKAFCLFTGEEQAAIREHKLEGSIYDIRKFVTLAQDCNPNILDVLFCREEEVRICTPLGRKLRDNRHLFLSAAAKHRFSGYAMSQLGRIERHRRWLLDPPTAAPTREQYGLPPQTLIPKAHLGQAMAQIQSKMDEWAIDYSDMKDSQKVYVQGQIEKFLAEVQIAADDQWAAAGRILGFSEDFMKLAKRERKYLLARKEWRSYQEWKTNRNPIRAAMEAEFGYDLKHAQHLVRLMRTGLELLQTGECLVRRHDTEELKAIRAGSMTYDELLSWARAMAAQMDDIYKNQTYVVPHEPDREALNALCMELIDTYHRGNA